MALFEQLRSAYLLLNPNQRKQGIILWLMSMVMVVLDMVSILSILPAFLSVARGPEETMPAIIRDTLSEEILIYSRHPDAGLVLIGAVLILFVFKNCLLFILIKRKERYVNSIAEYFSKRVFQGLFTDFGQKRSGQDLHKIMDIPRLFSRNIIINSFEFFSKSTVILIVFTGLAVLRLDIFVHTILFLVPFGFLYYFQGHKRLGQVRQDIKELRPQMIQKSLEILDGRLEILLSRNVSFFQNSFLKANKHYYTSITKLAVTINTFPRVTEIYAIGGICILLLFFHFSDMASEEVMTMTMIYLVAIYKIIPSLGGLQKTVTNLSTFKFTIDELSSYSAELLPETENVARKDVIFEDCLKFEGISFGYPSSELTIENLSFEILKNDRVAIVGKSGTGKSTLTRLLMGFLQPKKGRLLVDDHTVDQAHLESWQEQISYVGPSIFLFEGSIIENIFMRTEVNNQEIQEAEEKIAAFGLSNILSELPNGIHTDVTENGENLSTGQQQRIGLIRALLQDRPVLILDEVTSHLDQDNVDKVVLTLSSLSQLRKTFIYVTHSTQIMETCNVILDLTPGSKTLMKRKS